MTIALTLDTTIDPGTPYGWSRNAAGFAILRCSNCECRTIWACGISRGAVYCVNCKTDYALPSWAGQEMSEP